MDDLKQDEVTQKYITMRALEHFSQVEADKGNDKKAMELLEAAAEIEQEIFGGNNG